MRLLSGDKPRIPTYVDWVRDVENIQRGEPSAEKFTPSGMVSGRGGGFDIEIEFLSLG